MLFTCGKLAVRRLKPDDAEVLLKWLNDPRVLEFYEGRDRPHDLQMVKERFLSKQDFPVTGCMVEYDSQPIGYIQYYQLSEEVKARYGYPLSSAIFGIDQFIGEPSFWNSGTGTLLISSMLDFLFAQKRAAKVVMDPQVRNARALRCYEKCGFKRIRILPKHELHEGVWQNCVLMEKER